MFKLIKFAIITITIIAIFIIYMFMGLGQGNSFTNSKGSFKSKDLNKDQITYEFCSYVEEIKAHVSRLCSREGGFKYVEFMKLFKTPVERKNLVSHMDG